LGPNLLALIGAPYICYATAFDSEKMTEAFTNSVYIILASNNPNRVVTFCDKNLPWINPYLKAAKKRKNRAYLGFFCKLGRRDHYWSYVNRVRNKTSKIILNAKEEYFNRLGRKLSDPNEGIRSYWSTLNRPINKKENCEYFLTI